MSSNHIHRKLILPFLHSCGYGKGALSLLMILLSAFYVEASTSLTPEALDDKPLALFEKGERCRKTEKIDSALIYYSFLEEKNRDSKDKVTRLLVAKSLSEIG